MRRPLLILLSLLVLLMQPAALLHGLSHGHAGHAPAAAAGAVSTTSAVADEHAAPAGLDCLQCLAFAAFGTAVLPALALAWRAPALRQAAPATAGATLRGGTGAGYHARGPPLPA